MKKLILGAIAVFALCAASCSKNETTTTAGTDSAVTDSISRAFGSYVGASMAMQCQGYTNDQKLAFMSALQQALNAGAGDNEPGSRGVLVAGQLLQTVDQFKQQGIDFDTRLLAESFRNIFLQDSVGYDKVMKYSDEFRTLYEGVNERNRQAREAEALASPEAQQNGRIAETFVNNLKSQDSAVQTTESGLTYKITEAGDAVRPSDNSTVKVKYTGKHLNGEVFDQSGDNPATFNLRGVVPGFREGLELIGQGGKATLYIPGNLAYGAQGQTNAGIGPNEMLIFEVELVEVH